jgi:hypothetical protein
MHRTRFQRFRNWSRRTLRRLLTEKDLSERNREKVFYRMNEDGYMLKISERKGIYSTAILGDKAMFFMCEGNSEADGAKKHYIRKFHDAELVLEKRADGKSLYYLFRPLPIATVLNVSHEFDEITSVMATSGNKPIVDLDLSKSKPSTLEEIKAKIDSL